MYSHAQAISGTGTCAAIMSWRALLFSVTPAREVPDAQRTESGDLLRRIAPEARRKGDAVPLRSVPTQAHHFFSDSALPSRNFQVRVITKANLPKSGDKLPEEHRNRKASSTDQCFAVMAGHASDPFFFAPRRRAIAYGMQIARKIEAPSKESIHQ